MTRSGPTAAAPRAADLRGVSDSLSWAFLANPLLLVAQLAAHRHLLAELTRREALARYRGSILGLLWSLLEPLLMFLLYLFVFSYVFEARWGGLDASRATYALNLYAGLFVHSLFAESVQAAPGLMLAHRSFVKRSIFPLEILPLARFLANGMHALTGLVILLTATLVLEGGLAWTVVLLPLVLLPIAFFSLGVSWAIASLGVFLRDLATVVRLGVLALLFLSPVFYPLERLPASWSRVLRWNPLAHVMEWTRGAALNGTVPSPLSYTLVLALAVLVTWVGLAFFLRTKRWFADVV